jgi:mRNA-degrading endonuclease RelE of RelBE toxin-antitoxin system
LPASEPYDLRVSASANRALVRKLPEAVATAVVHLLTGDLRRRPRQVGKPLKRELDDLWVARRGEYRVVYSIDDVESVVTVLDVAHRSHVYRRR